MINYLLTKIIKGLDWLIGKLDSNNKKREEQRVSRIYYREIRPR